MEWSEIQLSMTFQIQMSKLNSTFCLRTLLIITKSSTSQLMPIPSLHLPRCHLWDFLSFTASIPCQENLAQPLNSTWNPMSSRHLYSFNSNPFSTISCLDTAKHSNLLLPLPPTLHYHSALVLLNSSQSLFLFIHFWVGYSISVWEKFVKIYHSNYGFA